MSVSYVRMVRMLEGLAAKLQVAGVDELEFLIADPLWSPDSYESHWPDRLRWDDDAGVYRLIPEAEYAEIQAAEQERLRVWREENPEKAAVVAAAVARWFASMDAGPFLYELTPEDVPIRVLLYDEGKDAREDEEAKE